MEHFSEREFLILENLLMDAKIDKKSLSKSERAWNVEVSSLINKVWSFTE